MTVDELAIALKVQPVMVDFTNNHVGGLIDTWRQRWNIPDLWGWEPGAGARFNPPSSPLSPPPLIAQKDLVLSLFNEMSMVFEAFVKRDGLPFYINVEKLTDALLHYIPDLLDEAFYEATNCERLEEGKRIRADAPAFCRSLAEMANEYRALQQTLKQLGLTPDSEPQPSDRPLTDTRSSVPHPPEACPDESGRAVGPMLAMELIGGPSRRSRGRPPDIQRHCDIAALAANHGPQWSDHISEMCTEMDAKGIKPRKTENWKQSWTETFAVNPDIVKKAIQDSVNAAKKY